jgi:hypothetical protein
MFRQILFYDNIQYTPTKNKTRVFTNIQLGQLGLELEVA